MAFLKEKCGYLVSVVDGSELRCSRLVEIIKSIRVGKDKEFQTLACGHSRIVDVIEAKADAIRSLVSKDGFSLRPFQAYTVEFGEKANFNFLCAHQMGLGKTPIAITCILIHPEIRPALFIVKSSLKTQFLREIIRWSNGTLIPQIIENGRDKFENGYDTYIISFDLFRRMQEKIDAFGFKTIIIDECQMIKNPEAKRTHAIRNVIRGLDNKRKVMHVMGLSGTPIKNNAGEYFSILNMIARHLFYNYNSFLIHDCQTYDGGYGVKIGGLKDPDEFFAKTKDFIIRFERKDVMPELPEVSRYYRYTNMENEIGLDGVQLEAKKAYDQTLNEFTEFFDSNQKQDLTFYSNALAYLSRMRHITGLAKVGPCVDFIMEFIGGREEEDKITVFIHHRDVAFAIHSTLTPLLKEFGIEEPHVLLGDSSSQDRADMIEDFKDNPKQRIFICSTLAGGEGLNLQFCSDAIILERQWNPANEEQAECRFIRIGQMSDTVGVTYIVAVGTIDEYFAKIVEEKRADVNQTLGSETTQWQETSIVKDLMQILADQGRKKIWDHRTSRR